MDRLLEMEVFEAVNDTGSFARAAERLRMSPPAVTRAITSLEQRLGVVLLTRTTRRLSLTDAGSRFLESTRRLLSEIEFAEREAIGETGVPQGHLSITSSEMFGRLVLTPLVRAFQNAHPRITASVISLDRVVNLVDEAVDVAIRIGELPDSSLVARRVGEVRRVFFASPGYLAWRGHPSQPVDLKSHAMIGFTGVMPNREWHYKTKDAKGHVAINPRLEVNDAVSAIDAALAGDGITMALSYMVADHVRQKKLVTVLEDFLPDPVPVHLVYPRNRLIAPKLRAFLDFAAPRLQAELTRLSI